jgi:small redox-active disulfide protein 2
MKIIVYGSGCSNCQKLYDLAVTSAKELGLEYEIQKVEDINKIMEAGVMLPPALSLDGKIVVSGKVPSIDEIKKKLTG